MPVIVLKMAQLWAIIVDLSVICKILVNFIAPLVKNAIEIICGYKMCDGA